MSSWFVHVTFVPARTSTSPGVNWKRRTVTPDCDRPGVAAPSTARPATRPNTVLPIPVPPIASSCPPGVHCLLPPYIPFYGRRSGIGLARPAGEKAKAAREVSPVPPLGVASLGAGDYVER